MSKRSLYVVCKTLDQPTRIIGLPLDEFIPAAFLAVLFFALGKVIISILLCVFVVILMRLMKKGQGSGWLMNVCYWNLPGFMMQSVLRFTPQSHNRDWVS